MTLEEELSLSNFCNLELKNKIQEVQSVVNRLEADNRVLKQIAEAKANKFAEDQEDQSKWSIIKNILTQPIIDKLVEQYRDSEIYNDYPE